MELIRKSKLTELFKEAGAERVSNSAKDTMITIITTMASELITRSVDLTKFAGRKTVKDIDVKMATK